MILIDRLLLSGIRFVLDKVATAVDSELDDAGRLRDALLEAQMRLELGEIDEAEFAELEAVLVARMRSIREREAERIGASRIAGVEVSADVPTSED